MRLVKLLLFTIAGLALFGNSQLNGQTLSPLGFSYQAVVRDANGALIQNGLVSLDFEIYQGPVSGTPVYTETFSGISTNDFGLVNLIIGKGNNQFGNIDWGAGTHSVVVMLDGVMVDMTEFSSVPYSEISRKATEMELNDLVDVMATGQVVDDVIRWNGTEWVSGAFSVDDADADPANELQSLSLSGQDLTISNGNTVTLTDQVDDADADPVNEIQSLSLNGQDLAISNGNTVSLPLDDADADPLNELQTLSLNGQDLGISNGNTITLPPDQVDDADADPVNEIQSLSLIGQDLAISNGNTVTLPDQVDDADADPVNEIQSLSLIGQDLAISNGNTVTLPDLVDDADADPVNELQSLSLNGQDLSISTGNTVTLPDLVDDADADPVNELQSLDLSGNTLSISGISGTGAAVDLSSYVSPWEINGQDLSRSAGNVGIGTSAPDATLDVVGDVQIQSTIPTLTGLDDQANEKYFLDADNGNGRLSLRSSTGLNTFVVTGNANGGNVNIFDPNGNFRYIADVLPSGEGSVNLFGPNGNVNVLMNSFSGSPNGGVISMANTQGQTRATLSVLPTDEAGSLGLSGANGNANVLLNIFGGSPNGGVMGLADPNGASKMLLGSDTNDGGFLNASGNNGQLNALIGYLSTNINNGFIGVYDSVGGIQAGMYVDPAGNGVLFKDVNSFRMDHPTQAGKEIWYAAIEGPEAGAYERGTVQLTNGEAFVDFTEHFQMVINPDNYTVVLTPLDPSSKGLAVAEKTAKGFQVKELWQGTGNYSFDWEVKAVRKGYEDFRVIRDASELDAAVPTGTLVPTNNLSHPQRSNE